MTPQRYTRSGLALVVTLLVITTSLAGLATAKQTSDQPAFIVDVNSDGSATVTLRSTFDLTTDAEQEAFQTLIDDEQARTDAKTRFLERMRSVASDAENATTREMRVTDATIELRQTDDERVGVVSLSVNWDGLAEVQGETLRVTEPFASGYTPDRQFVVRAPDGYVIADTTPSPDENADSRVTWSAESELEGFVVEMEPTATPTQSGGQPGFGALLAFIAVLVAMLVAVGLRADR